MSLFYKIMKTPVGNLKLVASAKGLVAVLWENDSSERVRLESSTPEENHLVLVEATKQLQQYFLGKRKSFSIPLDPQGTSFQRKVWSALLTIPYGETRSYSELARQIEKPKASRAVGAANGKNPLLIVIPCHRVIGASGKLVGFAGGLSAKEKLLAIEKS